MQKQLMKIMQLRYWKYLVGLFVIIVGLQATIGVRTVNSWQHEYEYNHSKHFAQSFKEHPEYYFYPDTADDKMTRSLTKYQEKQNQVFRMVDDTEFMINSLAMIVVIVIVFSAGLLTFANDRRTNFDTFLFSSTNSRRRIYWTKLLYGIGTLLGSLIIGRFLYYSIIELGVKAPYAKLNMVNLVQHEFGQLILMVGIYTVGCLIGLVIGKLPTLIIGGYGFLCSLGFSIQSMSDTRRYWLANDMEHYGINYDGNVGLLSRLLAMDNNNQAIYRNNQQIIFFIGLLIFIGLLLLGGAWIYKHLSLENKYQLIQISSLKKSIVIIATLYFAWLLGMNGFFSRQPFELIQHHEKSVLLWTILRNIVIIGIIGWLYTERPWQRFKNRRLS